VWLILITVSVNTQKHTTAGSYTCHSALNSMSTVTSKRSNFEMEDRETEEKDPEFTEVCILQSARTPTLGKKSEFRYSSLFKGTWRNQVSCSLTFNRSLHF
jgi:hypothetical protein